MLTLKRIPSVFMYTMNIQNDVIGLVLNKTSDRLYCMTEQMSRQDMHLYGFFLLEKKDKLIYISSPFSNQGIPTGTRIPDPLFPHVVPPAIMVWIFVWKYIFVQFIHILQHFVLQLYRSTNFCFQVQMPFYLKLEAPRSL